ncbi:MAG TPA: general stress protein [Acidimicrobiia bacterium]|nr:general stress protein [Acidimicrobiia bacterium]
MTTTTEAETSQPVSQQHPGVIAVYDTMAAATEAIQRLGQAGIPAERLSIVTQNLESQTTVHGFVSTGDTAATGAAAGAGFGAIFSLLSGAAFFIVPGLGPVLAAGAFVPPLLGVMEGALGGAAVGGLVGAALGRFVGKRHIPKLEQQLQAGKYLLVVDGDAANDQARRVLAGTGAVEILTHPEAA